MTEQIITVIGVGVPIAAGGFSLLLNRMPRISTIRGYSAAPQAPLKIFPIKQIAPDCWDILF
jgi:hypothetical protein